MTDRRILVAAFAVAVISAACGSGDNSVAVKAHTLIKPGMGIWDALDTAEQAQFPDIRFHAWGKECSHPGVEVGREAGPRYLKVLHARMDPKYPVSGYSYQQEGFASREDFVAAVKGRAELFSGCRSIVFFFGRYGAWPAADSFEATVGPDGRITAVTAVEEVRD